MSTKREVQASPSRILLLSSGNNRTVDRVCLQRVVECHPSETNVLLVTSDRSGEAVISEWRDNVGERPANLGVVTTLESMRSTIANRPVDEGQPVTLPQPRNVVVPVDDVTDLTGITDAVSGFLSGWDNDLETTLYVDSLSAFVHRSGLVRTVCLVDDLLESVDATAYFRLETDRHDAHTLILLEPLFDSVFELSADEDAPTWTERSPMADAAATAAADRLPPDCVFDLLQERRRRLLLRLLVSANRPVSMSELANSIAAIELGEGEVSDENHRRVYTGLAHIHLPKLEDHGIVAVGERERTVELSDAAMALEPFLSLTVAEDLDG